MKKIFILLSILVFSNVSYSQWYEQSTSNQNTLKSVFFVNNTTGFACGFETVLKTTDCGDNWDVMFLEGYHNSIFFINENIGWICGEGGRIYKTINAGNNWIPLNSGVNVILYKIEFTNLSTGIVCGNSGTILKTTDSGISWNNINNINPALSFYTLRMSDNNNYVVAGNESTILKTSNSGASWDTLSLGVANPLFTLEFLDQNTGWVSGCCGTFMKTLNGGSSWSPEVYLTPGFTIYSMNFINEQTGWIAGDAGYILRTTNAGQSWDSLYSLTHSGLYSVTFLNEDTGFVVGYNGLILKTTNGGGAGYPLNIVRLSNEIPAKYKLDQNYPNPFNPVTVIRYSLLSDVRGQTSNVKLIVYNNLGKKVATLVNEIQTAGEYSVTFDGKDLPSGVYYYRLEAGNFSETKKMLLKK